MLRNPRKNETQVLIDIAEATGIFKPNEAQILLGSILDAFHSGKLDDNHKLKVIDSSEENRAVGWTYFSPSTYAEGVWDIWWIGAHPSVHGKGYGKKLLESAETEIKKRNGRVIIIETSSLPALTLARKFYPRLGYKECGRVPNFYASGDDKIIFSKSI